MVVVSRAVVVDRAVDSKAVSHRDTQLKACTRHSDTRCAVAYSGTRLYPITELPPVLLRAAVAG